MLPKERYDLIMKTLREKTVIKVADVMRLCDVSHETARHDLEMLQEAGLARRIHGGAVLIPQESEGVFSTLTTRQKNGRFKYRAGNLSVAKAAAQLVRPGDFILLGCGCTMAHMAQYLRNMSELDVATQSLLVVNELRDTDVSVFCLGGFLGSNEYSFMGALATQSMAAINVDIAFISCTGLDLVHRKTSDVDTSDIPRALIREHAAKMVLVCSADKLNVRSSFTTADLSMFDTVVVDERVTPEDEELLRSTGIEVIVAPMLSLPEESGEE